MTYDPFDFRAIRDEQAKWRDQAKRELLPGIDPADLKPGQRITISPNLRLGDRSYTSEIHTVVAVNSMHVQTRVRSIGEERLVLLLTSEHHFYAADHFEVVGEVSPDA